MSEYIISQIVATIFYLSAGIAVGFMLSKLNTRKTARSIVNEMEKRLSQETKRKENQINE